MSDRFPHLTAPVSAPISPPRRFGIASLPGWLQSLPVAELCVVGAVMMILAIA